MTATMTLFRKQPRQQVEQVDLGKEWLLIRNGFSRLVLLNEIKFYSSMIVNTIL
jgi:hypothetical protein